MRTILPIIIVFVVTGIQYAFQDIIGHRPYLLLYPTLFIACYFGNLPGGSLATLFATFGGLFLFSLPQTFHVNIFAASLFALTGFIVTFILHRDRKILKKINRIDRLWDSNIVGMIEWSTDGGVFEANDSFLNMLGYTREDLKNNVIDWKKITPEKWKISDDAKVNLLFSHGKHVPYEKEYYHKDGTVVPIIIGSAMLDKNKKNGVSFILDNREHKKALKTRDEFISIASHELKTPITSLKLQAQLMQKQFQKGEFAPDKSLKFVNLADKQFTKLLRIVDDMLDVSRIRSRKFLIEKERASLKEIIEEIIERFMPTFDEKNIDVHCELEEVVGEWDRIRLEQVVTNLLTNAIRYGDNLPIKIELRSQYDNAILAIKDHGHGIKDEQKEIIFERFERAASPTHVSGLGLGLYITKQIVEAHQGKIWVESEGPEKGSTFYVKLPI